MVTKLSDLDGRFMPDFTRWPVYVNDDNRVTCNRGGCEDADFLDPLSRRVSFGHVMMALWAHVIDEHPEDV